MIRKNLLRRIAQWIRAVGRPVRFPGTVALTAAILACGCSGKRVPQQGAVAVIDDIGRTITLPHPAQRIVLMTGSPTDALFALGAGDRIVGITDGYAESYPSTIRRFPRLAALPGVGSRSAPNVEAILELRPDIVLVSGSDENPEKNAVALKNASLPYAIMKSFSTLEDGCAQMERLGVLCGKSMQARIVTGELRSELAAKKSVTAFRRTSRPRVYYWWGSGGGTYGRETALSELVAAAGGENIADSAGSGFFDLSAEYVVKCDPEVIVYTYWRERDRATRFDELHKKPGFDCIAAVRDNRIFAIDGHAIHSVMMFPDALDSLTRWLHPELSDDKDATAPDMGARVRVTDDCGRTVAIPADPQRIVTVATSDVEIFYRLGEEHRLCGVPDGIRFPHEATELEKIGGMYGRFSAEKIVGSKPDLVLMTMSSWSQYRKNLDILEKDGLTAVGFVYPRTFYETIAQIRRIGVITGKSSAARLLADSLIARKNGILAKTLPLDSSGRPRVYMEWISGEGGRGSTCGNSDRDHNIITLAGGLNIFGDVAKSSFTPSDEEVIARNPQAIVITADTTKFPPSKLRDAVRNRSGWNRADAVKNNRIFIIDATITWANPRMIDGIGTIAALLHPELFK